jgi:hypothetical protein
VADGEIFGGRFRPRDKVIQTEHDYDIHWDGYGSSAQNAGNGNYIDSSGHSGSGFHKYGVPWTQPGCTFYMDDGQQK